MKTMQWKPYAICLALTGALLSPTFVPAASAADEESSMPQAVQDGSHVKIAYTLTVDGEVVDSSEGREPLAYVHGQKQIIPGLERELAGLSVGDAKQVSVSPEDGYGVVDHEAYIEVTKEQLPQEITAEVGQMLQGMSQNGYPFTAKIHRIEGEQVTLDLNHPLAGKTLAFDVKVIEVMPAQ